MTQEQYNKEYQGLKALQILYGKVRLQEYDKLPLQKEAHYQHFIFEGQVIDGEAIAYVSYDFIKQFMIEQGTFEDFVIWAVKRKLSEIPAMINQIIYDNNFQCVDLENKLYLKPTSGGLGRFIRINNLIGNPNAMQIFEKISKGDCISL